MKVFVIISVILMIVLGAAMVYLSPNRSLLRPEKTEGSELYKARQEALVRSTQEAMAAMNKLPATDGKKQATPAPQGSPAEKTPATSVPPTTPAP